MGKDYLERNFTMPVPTWRVMTKVKCIEMKMKMKRSWPRTRSRRRDAFNCSHNMIYGWKYVIIWLFDSKINRILMWERTYFLLLFYSLVYFVFSKNSHIKQIFNYSFSTFSSNNTGNSFRYSQINTQKFKVKKPVCTAYFILHKIITHVTKRIVWICFSK